MNDVPDKAPDQAQYRFVFSLSEQEIWDFRKHVGARVNRTIASFDDFVILILTVIVIGLVVYAAYAFDLFDVDALQAVLVTAYLAFVAGVIYCGVKMHRQSRRLAKAYYRLSAADNEQWEYSFDTAGLSFRSQTVEARAVWRAMRSIEHDDAMVLFWVDTISGAYYLPARVFAGATERAAFVRWAGERIAAARGQQA